MQSVKSYIFGLIAVFLWAAIPSFVKLGTTAENLSYLLLLRFLISSFFFLPMLKNVLTYFKLMPFKNWIYLSITLGANYYCQGLAMIDLPASWYVIIFSLNPIIVLLLLKTRMNAYKIAGLVFSIVGTLCFVNTSQLHTHFTSFILITIGMVTWVLYTLQIKSLQIRLKDLEITAITQWTSLIAVFIIWMFCKTPMPTLNSNSTIALTLLGITSPIAYFAFSYCMRKTPLFAVVSQYFEPIFGIILGILLFQENLTGLQILAASLIIIGAVLIEKK